MGATAGTALNARGFSDAVNNNRLPSYQHITHAGTYNQHFFEVGAKAKQLLQLQTGVGVSNCNLFGLPKRNFFLSMFLKSNRDGQPRDRSINVCVVLDISGSMGCNLSQTNPTGKTRLMLARDAIYKLYQKLQANDIFSLVAFHTDARTVISSSYVKNLQLEAVKNKIYQPFENGGTNIRAGFNQALNQIHKFKADITNYENRIVMLTDVCDNSVENEKKLILDIMETSQIGTTIIGVSSDFKAETCEKLKEVKGFNYLCAVEDADLQTYLVDRFDWTFFPCAQNITIKLVSDKISGIKVFGSADEERVYDRDGNQFIVSQFSSAFPSEIHENKAKKDQIDSLGGLFLVKFTPNNPEQLPQIDLKILLQYQDLSGTKYKQQYVISQKVSAEEFYSDSAGQKSIKLFYYAETMRNLLKTMNQNLNEGNKLEYINNLKELKEYCPQSKQEQLNKVVEIVQAL